ncbi:unnamed protein product [Lampetra planeri]
MQRRRSEATNIRILGGAQGRSNSPDIYGDAEIIQGLESAEAPRSLQSAGSFLADGRGTLRALDRLLYPTLSSGPEQRS